MHRIKEPTEARKRLEKYADLLRENDIEIRRLETLKAVNDGYGIQQIRITEIEAGLPEVFKQEQQTGRELMALIDQLQNATERQVLKMRYFDLLKWPGIRAAIYDDGDATEAEKRSNLRQLMRRHTEALAHLDAVVRR